MGMSISPDGYIACGSENNAVYAYSRSLPVPMACHRFGTPNMGPAASVSEDDEGGGEFISTVCWGRKSNVLVAANSVGVVKLLELQ